MSTVFTPAALRQLSSADAPLPGDLLPGDPPLVWTDVRVWEHNPGWHAEPNGHVLAPVDAAQRTSGGGVLVPHCPHRLIDVLGGRVEIADGEAVTVAVSLLRGGAEADRLGAEHGRWWVTGDGRPVLATVGDAPWRDELAALVALLSPSRPAALVAALQAAAAALSEPRRLRREGEGIEDALFATAQPLPLAVENLAVRARGGARVTGVAAPAEEPPTGMLHGMLRAVMDPGILTRVHAVWTSAVAARSRRDVPRYDDDRHDHDRHDHDATAARPRRRVPILVGCAVGVLVLTTGLLWPDGDENAAARPGPAESVSSDVPSPPAAVPKERKSSEKASAEPDLVEIGRQLVTRLAGCAATGCPTDVVEDVARPIPPGAASETGMERTITLVDDYGGAGALRVEGAEGGAQIAIIVKADGKWLIRDVYDVADQP